MPTESGVNYRTAVAGDEAGILNVFAEVAPEVPTAVRKGTEAMIQRFVASGGTWVAFNTDGNIVGYALAEPLDEKRVSLVYLGVSKAARDQHVCSTLVSKLQENCAAIVTDVRAENKSSMVERFERFGFVKAAPDAFSSDRTKLLWEE